MKLRAGAIAIVGMYSILFCVKAMTSASAQEAVSMSIQTLETARLVIRPFTAEDWRDVQQLALDWKSAPGPAFDKWPTSATDVKGLTGYFAKEAGKYFAVSLRKGERVIGLLALNGTDERKELELGHVILSDHQDNDLDKEALGAMVDHIFGDSEVTGIVTHNADPAEQLAPLKSLGFVIRDQKSPGTLVLSREQWTKVQGK
jgi:RimJ/RimL family protein N-acetyltransferase|tara:strand:- start:12514 stop:13119 length:606 start_codon:yes stop_codon:yes gene_type:complete